jgi:hypothetical protein
VNFNCLFFTVTRAPSEEAEMKRTSCSQSDRETERDREKESERERERERDCFAVTVTKQYTVEFYIQCARNSVMNPFQHTRQVKCMGEVRNLYEILTNL